MADGGTLFTDRDIDDIEKRIEAVYKEAAKEVHEKVADFTRRHKIKADIKLKDYKEGKISKTEYDNWMRGQIFQQKQWLALEEHITDVYVNANKVALSIVREGTFRTFMENANWEAYTIEKGTGINFGFGLYNSNVVTNLILRDPKILPEKKLDPKKDKAWNMKRLRTEIAKSIIEGEPLERLAKRLAEATGSQNMNSMRTHARTSLTGAQNSGRIQTLTDAENMSINVVKEWMATFDELTRTSHRDLDGEQRKVNEKFSNDLMYPGDPNGAPREVYNCRCTLVGDVLDYPEKYERYDNINGKPVREMTYKTWYAAKEAMTSVGLFQSQLGAAKSVQDVNKLMNSQGWFKPGLNSYADLEGCDLDSAKAIAASYEQVFTKYPKLKGKFGAPDASPFGMGDNTYAWTMMGSGKIQVNPNRFNNWQKISSSYAEDVMSNWHPRGTTAESIVTHEIGHAIDGLLAREGIKGGRTKSGEFRYASSTLRNTIMRRAAKTQKEMELNNKYVLPKYAMEIDVRRYVSEYATKNNKEWFAEAFAEYITSANPRTVARELGKELEKLMEEL